MLLAMVYEKLPILLIGMVMLAIILAGWVAFGARIGCGYISKSRFFSWPSLIAARSRLIAFTIILLSFVATLAVVWVLRVFPNSADEYGYLYEADTFLAGRLWNPLPPHHEFFSFLHIFEKNGKWVSEYPPGWSLILAFGRSLHLPYWIVCPLVGVLFLYTVWRLAERQTGELGGILALALVAFSPFFFSMRPRTSTFCQRRLQASCSAGRCSSSSIVPPS